MPKIKKTTWAEERRQLGKEPDERIAERMGITRSAVCHFRQSENIAAFADLTAKVRTDDRMETVPDRDYLRTVPLTVAQRQLITDRRIALGWTQAQLAEGSGTSVVTINRLENGFDAPSIKTFDAVCAALGLTWDANVSLTLRDK